MGAWGVAMRVYLSLVCGILLASCAAPAGGGGGGTRDVWGHRAGPRGFRSVVLDAGHGGHDSGARSAVTGVKEKDLALDVVRRVRRELGRSFEVKMMREGDEFVDLDVRAARAAQLGDVLLSVHFNSGPSSVRGPETFYWRVDSYGLAKRLQRNMAAVSPGERGSRGLVRRRLRLTRNPEIPCVLLELGYLSHPEEARLCSDAGYRQRMAVAIADAVKEQAARGDAGMGVLPPPIYAPPSRPTDAPE